MKQVGILYHPKIERVKAFTHELEGFLDTLGVAYWTCSAWNEAEAKPQIERSDLILSIGGDGTILRAARAIIPHTVAIVGINFGSLGFMTELKADEVFDKLPRLLNGEGWIEERAMLKAELLSYGKVFHALNDIFVGRKATVRLVKVEVKIDGEALCTYRADGIIVATATGSTGYSLAAGGPIIYPEAKEILLKPVCSHLTLDKALVLPPEVVVQLKVTTSHEAMISIDGQVELPVSNGDEITTKISPYIARFLRIQPKGYFYNSLEAKLKSKVK